jgi:hypothetical protein
MELRVKNIFLEYGILYQFAELVRFNSGSEIGEGKGGSSFKLKRGHHEKEIITLFNA